jgi:hypothetical protein
MNDGVVFATPWFRIVAKNLERSTGPHCSLKTNPAVAVTAVRAPNGRGPAPPDIRSAPFISHRASWASRSIAIAS